MSPDGAASAGKLSACSRSCDFVAAMVCYDSKHKISGEVNPWISLNGNLNLENDLCSGRGTYKKLYLLAKAYRFPTDFCSSA